MNSFMVRVDSKSNKARSLSSGGFAHNTTLTRPPVQFRERLRITHRPNPTMSVTAPSVELGLNPIPNFNVHKPCVLRVIRVIRMSSVIRGGVIHPSDQV